MARVSPVLATWKKNNKGECPIYLRFEAGDSRRYKSLGLRVKPTHWNERKQQVRKTHKHAQRLNKIISERLAEAEEAVLRLADDDVEITPGKVKAALANDRASGEEFFPYADETIEGHRRRGQLYTANATSQSSGSSETLRVRGSSLTNSLLLFSESTRRT